MRGVRQHLRVALQLLLIAVWLRQGLTAGQDTEGGGDEPAPAPDAVTGAAEVDRECPAELLLAFLKASSSIQAATAFPWPPPALKQGLSCTLELSQLSFVLPGTNRVCTVLGVTNNLLSILHSWQLVFQPGSKGLTAAAATGALLLNSTGSGDNVVQLINPASSRSIPAQGGSADLLVQLNWTGPSPRRPSGSKNSTAAEEPREGSGGQRGSGGIRPAVEWVYLNGLQCTRLPLARSSTSRQAAAAAEGEDGNSLWSFQDCGTSEWALDANGTLAGLDFGLDSWANSSAGATRDRNTSTLGEPGVTEVLAALRQLSCMSQLCCGLQVMPGSVVTISNSSSGTGNSTEPVVLAADGPGPDRSTTGSNTSQADLQAGKETIPSDITAALQQQRDSSSSSSSSNKNSSSTVGLVVGLVVAGGLIGALLAVLLWSRHKAAVRARLAKDLQQAASQQGLVQHGSGASSSGAGGAASLASLASAEWQQQQQQHYTAATNGRPPVPWLKGPQYVLPTHQTAPPHLISAAAAAATAELSAGVVWRASSWQGPDAHTTHAGTPLERSSSSPQPLQRTITPPPAATTHPTAPAPLLYAGSSPHSPSAAAPHLPPAGPGRTNSGSAAAAAAFAPTAAAVGSSPPAAASSAAVLSAASSPGPGSDLQLFLHSNPSTLGSTWGSLRRILGNSSRPAPGTTRASSTLASTAATTSSVSLVRQGRTQGPDTAGNTGSVHTLPHMPHSSSASHKDHQRLALTHYRPQLQLVQEAAPLSGAAFPPALGPQQLQLLGGIGGVTSAPHRGLLMSPQAGLLQHRGSAAAEGQGQAAISRRISPILSVHEDTSSATSTDSLNPAAWHLTDRQLLEDTPGWLNIDFASEVRLEKKLGEGGFGQVFRARWRGDVIAAKLVPFMSLVAQQHHSSTGLSLVSAAPGAPTPDAAAAAAVAAGQPPPSQRTGAGTDASSQLGAMRLGVQFSSGSLRAIKVEIRVLSQLSHPNIVAFKGACMAPPHICILEELAEGGSLYSRLYSRSSASKAQQLQQRQQQRQQQQQAAAAAGNQGTGSSSSSSSSSSALSPPPRPRRAGATGCSSKGVPPPPLSVGEVLHIAVDVSRAMVYLHTLQPQVVHRDLKPQNVLLDLQGRAKVCDFGISKMKDASLAASSTRLQAGTPAYMAPEQFEGCSVTEKVDVWAFGVLLWECFEQQQPWKELSPMQIIYSVGLQKERLQRPARCPDDLWQLTEACWAQDPRDRPSFADILHTLQHLQQQQQQQVAEAECGASPGGSDETPQPVPGGVAASSQALKQQPLSVQPPVAGQEEREQEDVDAQVAVVC